MELRCPRASSLAQIEEEILITTANLAQDDTDVPKLLAQLTALKARRSEVRDLPTVREVRLIPTGLTYAEAWEKAADDLDAQRALLLDIVPSVTLVKARHTRSPISERVFVDWPEEDPFHRED
jgi:site-specific DNA recombinase